MTVGRSLPFHKTSAFSAQFKSIKTTKLPPRLELCSAICAPSKVFVMTKTRMIAAAISLLLYAQLLCGYMLEAQVTVRQMEGLVHGFLTLSSLDGKILADGEQTQVARGDQVTMHLILRFKDGSIHEETTVFSQRHIFRLISSHLKQTGPAFKQTIETSVIATSGQVSAHFTDGDGKEKTITGHLQMPVDVANGMVPKLIKNLPSKIPRTRISIVTTIPKVRIVKIDISPVGKDSFSMGGFSSRDATHYIVKANIGGIAGLLAPLAGKQPQETHVWVLEGEAPVFFRSEGPLYQGGPVWRIELTSPH